MIFLVFHVCICFGVYVLLQVMASLVDSKAEFERRAKDLVGDAAVTKLLAESIDTFATLAYAVADQPNHIDDGKLDALSKKLWSPNVPTLGQVGALRRLSFEGLTFSLQDLKNRGDPEASSVKQLPAHEREHRRTQQAARLKGVLMEGDLEPGNTLVDKAAAMLHDGVVRYIPPSSCVSRDSEVASTRKDKDFLSLENGKITVKKKEQVFNTDLSSEFKLQQAFTRRGLALDRVGILSFEAHERLVRNYFFLASRGAPPGYDRPGIGAIIKADRELWTLVARECRDSCKPTSACVPPLDALVAQYQNDSVVSFCLFPLPSRGREWPKGKGGGKDRSRTPGWGRGKEGKGKQGKGKGGKGKKGQGNRVQSPWPAAKRPSMPKELRHLASQDDKGRRYCYGWNLDEALRQGRQPSATAVCTCVWFVEARTTGRPRARQTKRRTPRSD